MLICEDQGALLEGMEALRDSLLRKEIPIGRLHESVRRVMAAKARFIGNTIDISLEKVRSYFRTSVEG